VFANPDIQDGHRYFLEYQKCEADSNVESNIEISDSKVTHQRRVDVTIARITRCVYKRFTRRTLWHSIDLS
jgi:hypothetical protein